uniref:Uncharacterized protein n=1 Tax=Meloidogyne hapla TaxID=6305 RepID=A0A1I8BNI4_MELHA
MANLQLQTNKKSIKKYKDYGHNLTKWEQELDEKLKNRTGFWEHLEEIRLDHPRPSDSFDGNDFFLEHVDCQVKLSRNYDEKKKYLDDAIETYLIQEQEAKGKEDDKSDGNGNVDDDYLTWPTLTEMFMELDPRLSNPKGSPEGHVTVKTEILEPEVLEASSLSIIATDEHSQPLTPVAGCMDIQVKIEPN